MQLSDKIKKFSVGQAIDYLNRNPVKNLSKLLDWAYTFCAGKAKHRLPVGRRCFCTHVIFTSRCPPMAQAR